MALLVLGLGRPLSGGTSGLGFCWQYTAGSDGACATRDQAEWEKGDREGEGRTESRRSWAFLAFCFARLDGCLLGLRVELVAGLMVKGLGPKTFKRGTSGVSGHV